MSDQYYLDIQGQTLGPLTLEQVRQMYMAGSATPDTLFAQPESTQWNRLALILPLLTVSPSFHSQLPAPAPVVPAPGKILIDWKDRNRWVCEQCGAIRTPKLITPGSGFIAILLCFFGCLPGIIYTVWQLTSQKKACPECDSTRVYALDSPRGSREYEIADIPVGKGGIFIGLGRLFGRAVGQCRSTK